MRSRSSSSTSRGGYLGLVTFFLLFATHVCSGEYYGKLIGKLSELHHGVSGEVYAVDSRTIFVKDFTYDGEGPAAYFYAGNSKTPIENGFKIRDERGMPEPLKRYRRKGITLTLPEGKTLSNIRWFAVWCDDFSVNFGDVRIPRRFDYPKPQKLAGLNGVHGVSSEPVVIVDAQTLLVPNFSYDGEAPDAKFWVGPGPNPSPQGVRVPDENGKINPLRRYHGKTIVLTLPGDLTVYQLGHFGVWCEAFTVDFGHIQIPSNLNVPPSLKMLGVSPQNAWQGQAGLDLEAIFAQSSSSPIASTSTFSQPTKFTQQNQRPTTYRPVLRRDDRVQVIRAIDYRIPKSLVDFEDDNNRRNFQTSDTQPHSYARLLRFQGDQRSKLNCEVLEDNMAFEVRWAVAGDSIVVQLVGKLAAGQYMSFGLSANPERSVMVGGDIVVAWVDKETLQGYAVDYFLDAKSQCSGGRGSCPDVRIQDNTDSIRLLNAAMVNGYSIVTYQRALAASDELDRQIRTNGSQAIIWAIGPLNERNEVSFHSHYLKTDKFIEFGRPPSWNCPMPDTEPSSSQHEEHSDKVNNNKKQELVATTRRPSRAPATPAPAATKDAWEIPPIQCYEPEDGVFYAQMGPTGGIHGYPAITGHVGWGISWYINGLLIPEINVVRGKKYTFVVEGGENSEIPARYHPFYITDDPVGGYQHKTPEEKAKVKIFAGIRKQRGVVRPVGIGRLCNWTPDENQPAADEFSSFGAYQRTLSLVCDRGEPGIVEWTPDENTPDTVYYQCFTHRYLGWKINVVDSCDISPSASETHEMYLKPPPLNQEPADLESAGSIRVSSKVTPSPDFYQGQLEHGKLRANHPHHQNYQNYHPNTHSMSSQKLIINPQLTRASMHPSREAYERLPMSYIEPHRSPYYSGYVIQHHHHNHHHTKDMQRHQALPLMRHQLGEHATPQHVASYYREVPSPQGWQQTPNSDELDSQQSQVSPVLQTNPQSHLIPDHRPINFGNMKHMYQPSPQTAAYSYPRNPTMNNQVPPSTQVMILRRPGRRPQIIQPEITPQRYIERKKAVYKAPAMKLSKIDKQKMKIESKISSEGMSENVKPARNTGFDPDSIVIEGGFKPIIRGVERDEDVARSQDYSTSYWEMSNDDKKLEEENFEPVYLPPVRSEVKKSKKKIQGLGKVKQRLDDIDDMEMAADGLESYYLPPSGGRVPEERLAPGTLITFDGKRVKDSSLARSISPKGEEQTTALKTSTGRLSDVLSRTPQFGKFRGELPPPVPGDIRSEGLPQLDSRATTKLTKRTKRSPHEGHEGYEVHENHNSTHGEDQNAHDFHEGSTLASTGQILITNIEYVALTIILYFVM